MHVVARTRNEDGTYSEVGMNSLVYLRSDLKSKSFVLREVHKRWMRMRHPGVVRVQFYSDPHSKQVLDTVWFSEHCPSGGRTEPPVFTVEPPVHSQWIKRMEVSKTY